MGIDLGLQNFLTISDGFTLEAPNFLKTLQSKLKLLQRRVAKKKKHSKNWEKAQVEVARLHHYIANTRKNFHFQVAHQLCDQADLVFVEEIDFRISAKGFFTGLTGFRNHSEHSPLGKQILDGGFGQFRSLLQWVCWKRGKYFAQLEHKYKAPNLFSLPYSYWQKRPQ